MTLSSIFSLKERKPKADDSSAGGIHASHWFWGAANRIQHAVDRNQKQRKNKELSSQDDSLSVKIKRDAFVFLNPVDESNKKTFAQCSTCRFWAGPKLNRCAIHGPDIGIDGLDSCALYVNGKYSGEKIEHSVNPNESGLVDDTDVRCQNCIFYVGDKKMCGLYDALNKQDPSKWDLDTIVSPYSCCNAMISVKNSDSKQSIGHQSGKLLGETLRVAKKEAASSTTMSAVTIPGAKKESAKLPIRSVSFREKSAVDTSTGGKFDVVLITEGMGNFHDAFYYHKDALESAVSVFNGLKSYIDHPSLEEEEIRPERSVRDIFGHFENLYVSENDQGCAQLVAVLDTIPSAQKERDLMIRAIENAAKFPETPFVGLSINANGDAETTPIEEVVKFAPKGAQDKLAEAIANGIDTVKVVRQIKSAVSCDLVTEAGAGGKITNQVEGETPHGKGQRTERKGAKNA